MWDIIKNALSRFSSENDQPKSKGNPIKLTPLNLKEYAKQEDKKLVAKQDATAFRSPTKPVSNSSANVAAALKAQSNNTKSQQKAKVEKEKEKYYNPEVKNVKSGDPKLDFLYKNQWLMDVPILGDYIKGKAKEVAEKSGGATYVYDLKDLELGKKVGEIDKYSGNTVDYNSTTDEVTSRKIPKIVDQYFSDKSLFEKSKYKPTSDYLTFLPSYSLKGDYDKKLLTNPELSQSFKGTIDNVLGAEFDKNKYYERSNPVLGEKVYNEFLKNKKPVYIPFGETGPMSTFIGADLGAHKVGLAWDKEKNLPYISISDAWDFEPEGYVKKRKQFATKSKERNEMDEKMYVEASLMQKAGNPFKIYDRFYFDPKTKRYIPDAEVSRRRSTKVNTNKPVPVNRDVIAKRLSVFNDKK
jgi:hypothetical protein